MTLRERIVEAATRRFVDGGVLATRIEDIRREAGVSVGALYHHFPDKQALHAEAFVRALDDYQAGFLDVLQGSEDARTGVRDVVRHHMSWVAAHRDAAALLFGEQPSAPSAVERLADQNRAFFTAVLRWWRIHARYGSLRELEPASLYALWLGPAHEYCRHWLAGRHSKLPGRATDPEAVADDLADAAWSTLKGGEPREQRVDPDAIEVRR
jgi:AcrR family transcriptional regulator